MEQLLEREIEITVQEAYFGMWKVASYRILLSRHAFSRALCHKLHIKI